MAPQLLFCSLALVLHAVSGFQAGYLAVPKRSTPSLARSGPIKLQAALSADIALKTLLEACETRKTARSDILGALKTIENAGLDKLMDISESHRMRRMLDGRWEVVFSSFLPGKGYIPVEQVIGFKIRQAELMVKTMVPPFHFNEGVRTTRSILYNVERRSFMAVKDGISWAEKLENALQDKWFTGSSTSQATPEPAQDVDQHEFEVIHVDGQLATLRSKQGAISLLYRVEDKLVKREEMNKEAIRQMYAQELGEPDAAHPSDDPKTVSKLYTHMAIEMGKYVGFFFGIWALSPFINTFTFCHAHGLSFDQVFPQVLWNLQHGFDAYTGLL